MRIFAVEMGGLSEQWLIMCGKCAHAQFTKGLVSNMRRMEANNKAPRLTCHSCWETVEEEE